MEKIRESIIIKRPVDEVFRFLKDIKPRLMLNPCYKLIAFKKLTEGPISKNTRFRITFQTDRGVNEYISEIVDLKDNEFIKTRDVEGRLTLTLSLSPVSEGTLLTHEEEFAIPRTLLDEETVTDLDWRTIFKHILHLDRVRFMDPEREKKVAAIKEDLRKKLQEWLRRIKETLEVSSNM